MNNKHFTQSNKKRANSSQEWEHLQLQRLLWALVLFLTVFLGKQIYPEKLLSIGEEVITVLGRSTDFETVFAELGDSLSHSGGVLEGIEAFCMEVFGAQPISQAVPVEKTAVFQPEFPKVKSGLLSQEAQPTALFSDILPESQTDPTVQEASGQEEPLPEKAVPAVGTVLTIGTAPEESLPAGYTVDELSFGALETVNPVLGCLNSGFGYRDHPVNGKYLFHSGVDISADAGDPIAAFADGMVEYVGEDDSYGLYFQLDHGNGIKSFYAHCQTVDVETGQQVRAGETVAKVGSTGTATGPHLHLELKCGDLRVDPAYYIDLLATA